MELVNVNTNQTRENGNRYVLLHFGIMIRKRDDFDRLANSLLSMKDVTDILKKWKKGTGGWENEENIMDYNNFYWITLLSFNRRKCRF